MPDFVYVIGSIDSNTVKIGVSSDPHRRVRKIQYMSPVALTVLWSCPGSFALERALHQYFSSKQTHGEWFLLGEEPVATVQAAVTILRPIVEVAVATESAETTAVIRTETSSWPSGLPPIQEQNRCGWLHGRILRGFPNAQTFTLGEVAEVLALPVSVVETYGEELIDQGVLVAQKGRQRGGQQVFVTRWDMDERWYLLGSAPSA